ncbi:MAG TPA: DUF2231 domain-containing protein [Vicinamibacterales bacterium]|nr:DUF2231 domain-containing protein [Vicinamibacterales bacterium]
MVAGLYLRMALIGRFHPVLVHFPIALIVAAFGCELVSMATRLREWHVAAVANLRIGAVFAVGSAIAGWIFARSPMVDASPSLEWHRWAGACATLAAVGAVLSARSSAQSSSRSIWIYRSALGAAAALVGVTGHLGGVLVWGAHFFRL